MNRPLSYPGNSREDRVDARESVDSMRRLKHKLPYLSLGIQKGLKG